MKSSHFERVPEPSTLFSCASRSRQRLVGGQADQEEGIADVLGCFLQPGILEAGIPGGGRRTFPALDFRPDGAAAGATDLRA